MPVQVHLVDHPLIAAALTRIRDETTPNTIFRQELERIGTLLLAEATAHLETREVSVRTPIAVTMGRTLKTEPVIVPILRAGLGFLQSAQTLIPGADIGFVGISRDEHTFEPKPYVNKLPESLTGRTCIVLDPMLATGGSLALACRLLTERGANTPIIVVCALAAPEGIAAIETAGLNAQVFTAAIDERLNENAYIVPGLGDAGDRQFGTAE